MDDYLQTFEARGHEYNAATAFCPTARDAERLAVLRRLACKPGQTIIDAPAGGGYVADGLAAQMAGNVKIICVEPSQRFAAAIGNRFRTLINPLQQVELPARSVDGIVSLAGLHHISDRLPVYREWARLLKPGGRVAVGDVGTSTGTANFLNVFVNQHTPGGHDGLFIAEHEFTEQLSRAGFDVSEEALENVAWQFPDISSLGKFCKSLFAIETATADETVAGLRRHVGIEERADGSALLRWQLRYATAVRRLTVNPGPRIAFDRPEPVPLET